jgi:PIN domain nuclease of toxin-antitoxin system
VVPIWELVIKINLKKLTLSDPLDVFIAKWISTYQLNLLSVESQHALAILGLPDIHRDPFDRMLISQAKTEAMSLVTADAKLAPYGVTIIW